MTFLLTSFEEEVCAGDSTEGATSASAVRFFKQSINVVSHEPDRITTDKNPAYPGAIEEAFATEITHRTNNANPG